MSGTSLDGLDLVCAEFSLNNSWEFRISCAETIPYASDWVDRLQRISNITKKQLNEQDLLYTKYLGAQVKQFLKNNQISDLDFVSSHGHTAKHRPENGLTFQIGNLPQLADDLGYTVVCDFRTQDVALKGQGAPLVPIGDQLLFGTYDYCLNLGGFSNISYSEQGRRIAFDISPVNTVLNHYAQELGMPYDDSGNISREGQLQYDLLKALNALAYYQMPWPKSLGIEWVNSAVLPLVESFGLGVREVLRTFTEHIAIQISKVISSDSTVLVTGGGAYNSFLLERCRVHSMANFIIPDDLLIDFKEALVFGFLGVLRTRGEVNCLSSVTGAEKDHSSGMIYRPKIALT
jgi:anhydro-N-acetylmuramic acid kinase